MDKLNEKTLIPIGLAIVTIGGGSMWIANIRNQANAATEGLKHVGEQMVEYRKDIEEIKRTLARIEGKLERVHR